MTDLSSEIRQWDGRSRAQIEAVFERWKEDPEFVSRVAGLLDDPEGSVGATWLLKRGLEARRIEPAQVEVAVFGSLPRLTDPDSRLHVLQVMPRLRIPPDRKAAVEAFVRGCLGSPYKFESAWAFTGLHALAAQFPEYRQEATDRFELGLREGPPSTKARIRHLVKQGFPE